MTIRVLLVDAHSAVREGLRMFLEMDPELEVVGEAETGEDSFRRRPWHHPLVRSILAALVVMVLFLTLWQRTSAWYRDFSNQIVLGNTLATAHSLANGISRELGFRLARVQQLDAFVQREAGSADFAEVFATFAAELERAVNLGGAGIEDQRPIPK